MHPMYLTTRSIVDVDVQTDVILTKDEPIQNTIIHVDSGDDSAVDAEAVTPCKGQLDANAFAYYQFEIKDVHRQYTILLQSNQNDADLFLSFTHSKPSQLDHDYRSQRANADDTISLSTEMPDFKKGNCYIAVYAYKQSAQYTILVRSQAINSSNKTTNQSSTTATSITQSTDSTQLCDNCLQQISQRAFQMHSLQCARLNWRCAQCNIVLPLRERQKHEAVEHNDTIACECGLQLTQPLLHVHRQHDCSLRLLQCIYCPLSIAHRDKGKHQQICGLQHSLCPDCHAPMQRKEMRRHMAQQHQREERQIKVQDFWIN
jgi:hypothetical protein